MNLDRLAMPALLAHWARAVDRMEHLASSERDPAGAEAERMQIVAEYTTDLAVRHEIALRIRVRPATSETRGMLAELDDTFLRATREVSDCILGSEFAAERSWTARREWYYWRAV